MPASDFALPGRRYPIEDKAHARDALAQATRFAAPTLKTEVFRAVKRTFPDMKVDKK